MAEGMVLSTEGVYVEPLVAPPSPVKAEPAPEPSPIKHYSWMGVLREWLSAPLVWMEAMPAKEAAYLEKWRQR